MSHTLASMTGYARAHGTAAGASFACEVKSVNARGLDIRMRLAPGLDELEGEIRRRISSAISRGSVSVTVTLDRSDGEGEVRVNQKALETVLDALQALSRRIASSGHELAVSPPRLDGILALKGVIEQHQAPMSEEDQRALHQGVIRTLEEALSALIEARLSEGSRLAVVLHERIDEIAVLTGKAEAQFDREAILEKLRGQVADLLQVGPGLSEERLAQEAVLLATKADIREELDRLSAHVASARELISTGGAVGRKLDFLSQEFNREANTLCSKSNTVELTAIGLDLKAVIDQLREQVQNIE